MTERQPEPAKAPRRRAHLVAIGLKRRETATTSVTLPSAEFESFEWFQDMIGSSMAALLEAGTCVRGCRGGDHLMERLLGRAYNLASAAWLLILAGYYDEAMNLVRSMAEVQNLLVLATHDETVAAFDEWKNADSQTRLNKFKPSQIRRLIEPHVSGSMMVSGDRYKAFCELFTHVTPQTAPNTHRESGRAVAGGMFQIGALKGALVELMAVVVAIAFIAIEEFKLTDLQDDLMELANDPKAFWNEETKSVT